MPDETEELFGAEGCGNLESVEAVEAAAHKVLLFRASDDLRES